MHQKDKFFSKICMRPWIRSLCNSQNNARRAPAGADVPKKEKIKIGQEHNKKEKI